MLGLLGLIYTRHAHAYFDPGMGSIIIQSLVGIGAFIALSWHNIKIFVRSKLSKSNVEAQVNSDQETSPNNNPDNSDIKRCD